MHNTARFLLIVSSFSVTIRIRTLRRYMESSGLHLRRKSAKRWARFTIG
jgi:hypothetical protein